MNEEEFKTVEMMTKYGGSFVKALAECFHKADADNFLKLKLCFYEYWIQYTKMAKKEV
ncbi:MAG: hypothetical protein WAV09_04085 [Minisyncoccia bacterium]